MDHSQVVREFATLISDRRLEIDGLRWRASAETPDGRAGVSRAAVDVASRPVIVPAFSVERWTVCRGWAYELEPRLSPAFLDAHGAERLSYGDRLTQSLRYSALPLRLEPLNSIQEHRCIPSGGNTHAVELWIVMRESDDLVVLRLSPHDMRLVELGRAPDQQVEGDDDDIAIVLVGRLSRVVETYGEFGLSLLLMEAGLLQAQLATLLRHLGIEARAMTKREVSAAAARLPTAHWSQIAIAGLISRTDGRGLGLRRVEVANHVSVDTSDGIDGRDRLKSMVEALRGAYSDRRSGHDPAVARQDRPAARHSAPFVATAARSSGDVDASEPSRPLTEAEIESIVRSALDTAKGLRSAEEADDLALLVVGRIGDVVQAHAVGADGELRPYSLNSRGMAAAEAVSPSGVSATISIFADDGFAAGGDAGRFAEAFIQAGRLAQSIGLTAATLGAYARPYKAYPDALVNAQLPIERRSLLQVQVGFLSRQHLAYPLQ